MKKYNLKDFKRGWFLGNFEPSVLKTDQVEIGVLSHSKGEVWPKHYHKIATEYNVLLEGKMMVGGEIIEKGNIFVFDPNEVADPIFLEDCTVLCIKTPSIIGDKYEIN
jgi:quercetin dioxygenase-like cupin family protein